MFDLKTKIGASFLIAMVLAMLTYALLSPIVSWYLTFVPGIITCSAGNWSCDIATSVVAYVIPIGVLFLGVFSVIEVFSNGRN